MRFLSFLNSQPLMAILATGRHTLRCTTLKTVWEVQGSLPVGNCFIFPFSGMANRRRISFQLSLQLQIIESELHLKTWRSFSVDRRIILLGSIRMVSFATDKTNETNTKYFSSIGHSRKLKKKLKKLLTRVEPRTLIDRGGDQVFYDANLQRQTLICCCSVFCCFHLVISVYLFLMNRKFHTIMEISSSPHKSNSGYLSQPH